MPRGNLTGLVEQGSLGRRVGVLSPQSRRRQSFTAILQLGWGPAPLRQTQHFAEIFEEGATPKLRSGKLDGSLCLWAFLQRVVDLEKVGNFQSIRLAAAFEVHFLTKVPRKLVVRHLSKSG